MTKRIRRLLLLVCCLSWCLCALPAYAAKHALLIGIADYKATSGFSDLDGTINDIELVRTLLKERFDFKDADIRVLKNAEATHEGIQRAFAELEKKVAKDDIVYIHYSGHGSLTPNLNGMKKPRFEGGIAYDSTWVPFGSRPKPESLPAGADARKLDYYDVLNEEVGEWLLPIYQKTDNIAFVSDSCHSGNMTRGGGEAPKVRAIDIDMRKHPLGPRIFKHADVTGVVVGAAREDQQAGEYEAPDGKSYGLFTWNWVQALNKADRGETWEDAFKRTLALIGSERDTRQHPQIQGKVKRAIFAGDFPPSVRSVSVGGVSANGKTLKMKLGTFAGITAGSVYKKKDGEGSFVIKSVKAFDSEGEVTSGSFKNGDLAVEESHAYPYTPLKIFIAEDPQMVSPAERKQDKALVATLKREVATLPGYQLAGSQKDADFMLMVIRPMRKDGKLVYETRKTNRPAPTLPMADRNAKAEIWALTPDEQPTVENMQLQPPDEKRAVELVVENLKKVSRIREIKHLGAGGRAGEPVVELFVTRYTPDPSCQGEQCLDVPDEKATGRFRPVATVPAHQFQGNQIKRGEILTFAVKNNTQNDLYCYLLDISPAKGKIEAVYPRVGDDNAVVLVKAGSRRNFGEVAGILIEDPGEDIVKLIASQMPLDVSLFEQTVFATRGATKGEGNPLEDFLARAMGGASRGGIYTNNKRAQWGTVQFSYEGI
ncbi:caspase family protein [Geomonas paludis]|uniref:Caspase family protein n=1 Tax=Geomonas paludis TaxID=2740185 RepID=A0A6V8MVB7_9BACT|nr:caspase family protein [Geomonas paludis]UPU38209.1 caspase family protein [Geomonas paludis]GFO63259.1 hypothetical protein GMPD_11780 [Geomonas paludis]